MLKKIVIICCLILWPLNLYFNGSIPKPTIPQTIFLKDYEAEQLVLRNIHLYPTPLFARVFQNKGRIYLNKFLDNFFALTDPNNYFFGLHPRPIVPNNKNLFKFPFIAIVFFLYGIFNIDKYKYKKVLFVSTMFLLALLSILNNFDGYDFVLWLPISLLIIYGIDTLHAKNKKLFNTNAILFLIFAIPEIMRSILL